MHIPELDVWTMDFTIIRSGQHESVGEDTRRVTAVELCLE